MLCPNCGCRFEQRYRSELQCSVLCYAEAQLVRYYRRSLLRYGTDIPEDVMAEVKMKMAHTLGGGYDRRGRRLSQATRDAVIERDGGLCVQCGQPGREIDHIDGSSNAPDNLRLLCVPCHYEITMSRMAPITDEDDDTLQHRDELLVRVYAPEPLRPSDDEEWSEQWRAWLNEHRQPVTT